MVPPKNESMGTSWVGQMESTVRVMAACTAVVISFVRLVVVPSTSALQGTGTVARRCTRGVNRHREAHCPSVSHPV